MAPSTCTASAPRTRSYHCFVCDQQTSEYHIRWCSDNGEWNWFTVCRAHCPAHHAGENKEMTCSQWARQGSEKAANREVSLMYWDDLIIAQLKVIFGPDHLVTQEAIRQEPDVVQMVEDFASIPLADETLLHMLSGPRGGLKEYGARDLIQLLRMRKQARTLLPYLKSNGRYQDWVRDQERQALEREPGSYGID